MALRLITNGMALLADDLDGQGHKSTFTPDDAVTFFLVLPEDFDPTEWRIIRATRHRAVQTSHA